MILWGSGRWRDGRTTLGGMRVLPAGPDALLLDFGSDDDPAAAGEHAWRALSEALAAVRPRSQTWCRVRIRCSCRPNPVPV